MNLTYDNFKKGTQLYHGNLGDQFYFNGSEIFKLKIGEFFKRTDWRFLPLVGFFPEIRIYNINGKLVLFLLTNHYYIYIGKIKVI